MFEPVRPKSLKVSGRPPEHSRFRETSSGDRFDMHCMVGEAVRLPSLFLAEHNERSHATSAIECKADVDGAEDDVR